MIVPWWVHPWKTIRVLRRWNERQAGMIRDLGETVSQQRTEISGLKRRLSGLLAAGPVTVSAQVPSTGNVEFVLVGIDRTGQGKRLIASRKLGQTVFAMTEPSDPPPRWKIGATMAEALFIDKPGYDAALEHMAVIWRNWDSDERAGATGKRALAPAPQPWPPEGYTDIGPAEGGRIALGPPQQPLPGTVPDGKILPPPAIGR
jgi:hypothetical protein